MNIAARIFDFRGPSVPSKSVLPSPPPRVVFLTVSPSPAATVTHGAHPAESRSLPPFYRAPADAHCSEPILTGPAAALVPAPSNTGAQRFPNTVFLLTSTLQAILDDHDYFIVCQMVFGFLRTCDALILKKDGRQFQGVRRLITTARADLLFYLRQPGGIPLCVSTDLEQLNRKRNRENTLGFLIPAINWALCETYENTFISSVPTPAVLRRRGQLGSLVSVTWLHELQHSFFRWRLQEIFDPITFITPDFGGLEGESGWTFEHLVFGGVLQARWRAEDVGRPSRFSRIQDVWLQSERSLFTYSPPLQLISSSHLNELYQSILQETLTIDTIRDFLPGPAAPAVTYHDVTSGDRVLLRGTFFGRDKLPDPIDLAPQHAPFITPHCGLALERMMNASQGKMVYFLVAVLSG
ncbi:hypothetical protein C8R44DRAFT_896365 [Mycena epipterygia]|nr:hypothetical protein C8R44DRAFT_896365 [Mycena epipterygia]